MRYVVTGGAGFIGSNTVDDWSVAEQASSFSTISQPQGRKSRRSP